MIVCKGIVRANVVLLEDGEQLPEGGRSGSAAAGAPLDAPGHLCPRTTTPDRTARGHGVHP